MRVPLFHREAAMYVVLRRDVGYSINMCASFGGRSRSMIHRILKANGLTGYRINGSGFATWKVLHPGDMRKSRPKRISISAFLMEQIRQMWLSWVCGEGEKPP